MLIMSPRSDKEKKDLKIILKLRKFNLKKKMLKWRKKLIKKKLLKWRKYEFKLKKKWLKWRKNEFKFKKIKMEKKWIKKKKKNWLKWRKKGFWKKNWNENNHIFQLNKSSLKKNPVFVRYI